MTMNPPNWQARTATGLAPRIHIHPPMEASQADGDIGLGNAALLPRLSPSAAKSLNRIYTSGTTFELETGGAVWYAAWEPDPVPLAASRRYPFQLGEACGHLRIDPLAERMLLGDAASDVVPPDLRALLLADALEPVFPFIERHAKQPFRFTMAEESDARPERQQSVQLSLLVQRQESAQSFRCAIEFDDERFLELLCPDEPMPHSAATAAKEDWSWIPVPLGFRLGTTRLKLDELQRIACGDIVRIDAWRAAGRGLVLSSSLPGATRYAITAHAVDTKIIVDRIEEETLETTKTKDALTEQGHPDASLNDLESLEVTLTFELGTHTVSLGELRSLRPGVAIELAQPLQRSAIRILANGRPVGSGHLIALGDKLGIRVSDFAKHDHV